MPYSANLTGHPDRAARVLYAALDQAPAGSHRWTVPVDPLLQVNAHPKHWEAVLTLLRSRAA